MRRGMIERNHPVLSVGAQCRLLWFRRIGGLLLSMATEATRPVFVKPPRGTKRIHSMYVPPAVPSRSPRSVALTPSRCLMAPPSPRGGSAHPSGSAIKAGMTAPSADEGTSPRSGDDGLRHDTASRKCCPSALEDQRALTISCDVMQGIPATPVGSMTLRPQGSTDRQSTQAPPASHEASADIRR